MLSQAQTEKLIALVGLLANDEQFERGATRSRRSPRRCSGPASALWS